MSPLGKLPTPYSEKTASLTTSSTHNLDNAALGWHLRSSQQESDTMLSSQYPVLSPRETASSGVNATIWGSEFMDEEDPPPYEPRS
ncbi:hypothetical protein ONZ51_g8735 [Trametes cubensis]|uniref:Uncharacterized protein n=1 Tax=Trametes cubensis TaxID=1111947 RepID=A0AAD7TNW6_9APHY|nr:hypothetical protein ONZ51_g8735 [Trametes cubensis]